MRRNKISMIDRSNVLNEAFVIVEDDSATECLADIAYRYQADITQSYIPYGMHAGYIFSYKTFSIIHVDPAIEQIIGISAENVLSSPMQVVFSEIIAPEHTVSAVRFSKLAFETVLANRNRNVAVNIEFKLKVFPL